MDAETGI